MNASSALEIQSAQSCSPPNYISNTGSDEQPVIALWKIDIETGTVRLVAGEPFPGLDSEGDRVFSNTHFADRNDALNRLWGCEAEHVRTTIHMANIAARRLKVARAAMGEKRFGRILYWLGFPGHPVVVAKKDLAAARADVDKAVKVFERACRIGFCFTD